MSMPSNKIDQKQLKELLHYCPLSGDFTWKYPTSFRVKSGDVAGYIHSNGLGKSYVQIRIYKVKYYAHQLAFLYINGELPSEQVDHLNGNGLDNSFVNLRLVNHSENSKNQKLRCTNTSGVVGVFWSNDRRLWQASITVKGKTLFLGRFSDIEDAKKARTSAEDFYGFHTNHGTMRPL